MTISPVLPANVARPVVAIVQPLFIPWQGFFALVNSVDAFVFLDTAQFVRRSFHSRNRLFTGPGNVAWLTVPVADQGRRAIAEVQCQIEPRWTRKTLNLLHTAYGRCAHYDATLQLLEPLLARTGTSLADFNVSLLTAICEALGIETRLLRSSDLNVEGHRSEALISILNALDAGTYLSPRGSAGYMIEDNWPALTSIPAYFQDYVPQPYPQWHSETFISHLSVVDGLLNLGARALRDIILSGNRPAMDWSFAEQAADNFADGSDAA
jgi:hypothetical protein